MNKKQVVRAAAIYASVVAGIFLILVGYNWFLLKQDLVRQGFARSNFPYTKYNQEELNKLFPQYPLENVATTQTPEETYALLREYLKTGKIDLAKDLFTSTNRDVFLKAMRDAKENNKLAEMLARMPEKIIKVEVYGNFASYKFEDRWSITFVKDERGVWKIDVL